MADSVAHDHSCVTTHRCPVVRHGGPQCHGVELTATSPPADADRIVLDGAERFAAVTDDGDRLIGCYDTPDAARSRDGVDRLAAWLTDRGRGPGDSVLLDVVDDGVRFGVRAPGETARYSLVRSADDGLAAIASELNE